MTKLPKDGLQPTDGQGTGLPQPFEVSVDTYRTLIDSVYDLAMAESGNNTALASEAVKEFIRAGIRNIGLVPRNGG